MATSTAAASTQHAPATSRPAVRISGAVDPRDCRKIIADFSSFGLVLVLVPIAGPLSTAVDGHRGPRGHRRGRRVCSGSSVISQGPRRNAKQTERTQEK